MKPSKQHKRIDEMMKASRSMLLIIAVAAALIPAFAQDTKQPFTISIGTKQPTVIAGSAVSIWVKQTNTSDQAVDCTEAEAGAAIVSYEYDVRDEGGNPVRKRDMKFPYAGKHWDRCELEPGKTADRNLLLSWLYDFTKPGKYFVYISRRASVDASGFRTSELVNSNTITITVLEAERPVPPPIYPVLP
jgi:hypothetical protein